jgi:hypothetical protein
MRESDAEGFTAAGAIDIWFHPHRTTRASIDQCGEWCRRSAFAIDPGEPEPVIHLPAGTKIWVAAGITDMRRGVRHEADSTIVQHGYIMK